jgi:hypothetical protein
LYALQDGVECGGDDEKGKIEALSRPKRKSISEEGAGASYIVSLQNNSSRGAANIKMHDISGIWTL